MREPEPARERQAVREHARDPVPADAHESEPAHEHAPEPAPERTQAREHARGNISYGAVLTPPKPYRIAQASGDIAVPSGPGLNAHMRVTCRRGEETLATWSGHVRWDGDVPGTYLGHVRDGRIHWEDAAVVQGVRVETRSDGLDGEALEQWMPPETETVVLQLQSLRMALGTGQGSGPGKQQRPATSTATGASPAKGKPAKAPTGQKASGQKATGQQATGQQGGSERGKPGGATAERGGVDGEFTRITGEAHGASHGARGGDGDRDDHGLRGGSGLIGLINVPAALRPLAEVLLIAKDAQPGALAGQWIKKAAGKAPELLRRELHEEAATYAQAHVRKLGPTINADKAFQRLSRVERKRFLQRMEWEIERIYFRRVEEGALSTIADLEAKLAGKVADSTRKQLQSKLVPARTVLDAAKVKPIAGRLPVNHRYAGKSFPADRLPKKYRQTGLQFSEDGYPDFTPYAKELPSGNRHVRIQYAGSYGTDVRAANRAAGLPDTPTGYTWHHHPDGSTMQLVPQDLHGAIGHTGGAAHYRHIHGDRKYYPNVRD